MKINGRLLLLAVVTGLFMRIWSGSERGTHAAQARRRSAPVVVALLDRTEVNHRVLSSKVTTEFVPAPYAAPEPNPVDIPVAELTDDLLAVAVGNPIPTLDENWTEDSAPIPLPGGIGAGAWRVVDDSGRVARLQVAPRDLTAQGGDESEFHVSQVDGRRWYFIRLHAAAEPTVAQATPADAAGLIAATGPEAMHGLAVLAEGPAAVIAEEPEMDVPACEVRNRKFDFTGYEAEPDRPAEVELPE